GVDLVDLFGAGGPRGEPSLIACNLDPADGRIIARRIGERRVDWITGELARAEFSRRQLLEDVLLRGIGRRINAFIEEFTGVLDQGCVDLAGITARLRRHLGGQQPQDYPILVRGPDRSVAAQEGGTGPLLAAESQRAVKKSVDEPFEADGYLIQLAAELCRHPIDDGAADRCLAHGSMLRPVSAVAEKIVDGRGEIVVWIHQA